MMRPSFVRTAVLAIVASGICSGAQAQPAFKLGVLTCVGGEGVGLILGSEKSYDCQFAPADGKPAVPYAATVTKIGLDVGVTDKTTMVWTVLAASEPKQARALAGAYVGLAADASLGLGVGAKVLVGGSDQSITLQPVSAQGQAGVNLAVGVAEMNLR